MQHITTTELQRNILEVLSNSSLPLSVDEITEKLRNDRQLVYGYRQVTRQVNYLLNVHSVTMVGKNGKTRLFSIPGQELEPWQSTSQVNDPKHPSIKVIGYNYSIEKLARHLIQASWTILSDSANKELKSQLTTLVLGNSAYTTLKAHSILPVAHVRKPLEELNTKLKILSQMIDTILNNELIKTGSSGNYISDQTRDSILEELEPWLMEISTNVRSNIHE